MTRPVRSIEAEEIDLQRARLARLIAKHTPIVGENETVVPGLLLFRRISTTPCYRGSYEPSFNVFAQGTKRVTLGATSYVCDGTSFLLSSIDVPVQSQVLNASEETPLLSMLLRLDLTVVLEIISKEDLPELPAGSQSIGLAVGRITSDLLAGCIRLLELLDKPLEASFLGRLIHREIIYRLLCSPHGERLRSIATAGDLSHKTSKAIAWLRANFRKPLHMEELAEHARMGVSTLHHHFRLLTSMTPLQYQKHLRLEEARQRMLANGVDATTAAYEVGYESVSQFNREYSRQFGKPPMRDVKAILNADAVDMLNR